MDIHELNRTVIDEFRANDGIVSGQFEGVPLLLLSTIGAKTGEVRTNPLAYIPRDDHYLIIASYAGAPDNPPWFYNLKANPIVDVEMGSEQFKARAEIVDEPERTETYQKVAAMAPIFAEYQSKTTRIIPIITLRRL